MCSVVSVYTVLCNYLKLGDCCLREAEHVGAKSVYWGSVIKKVQFVGFNLCEDNLVI
jgi:hypothetical protein